MKVYNVYNVVQLNTRHACLKPNCLVGPQMAGKCVLIPCGVYHYTLWRNEIARTRSRNCDEIIIMIMTKRDCELWQDETTTKGDIGNAKLRWNDIAKLRRKGVAGLQQRDFTGRDNGGLLTHIYCWLTFIDFNFAQYQSLVIGSLNDDVSAEHWRVTADGISRPSLQPSIIEGAHRVVWWHIWRGVQWWCVSHTNVELSNLWTRKQTSTAFRHLNRSQAY